MKNFEEVIDLIKRTLRTCTNGEHSFVVKNNVCTNCFAFPIIDIDGYCGSVEAIYTDLYGNVKAKGRTEWDNFDVDIDELSYDEVCGILNTIEEQLGMELSPTFKKIEFPITSVCREDITALGYKGAEDISDSVMEKIAQKMADAYVTHSFWEDLDFFVGEYCNLEKEENEGEDED